MIPLIYNTRNTGKHAEQWLPGRRRGGHDGAVTKGTSTHLGVMNMCITWVMGYGDYFIGIEIFSNNKLYAINTYSLLYVNYTSPKALKISSSVI